MKEIDDLRAWIAGCQGSYNRRMKKLQEGMKKTKEKRQEQTGKPYRQQ